MSGTTEKKSAKFFVNCPVFPFSVQKMEMWLLKEPGSRWVPLPCNGCEMMNGDPICKKCTAALTLMLYYDPDMDLSKPVSPLIWELIDSKKAEGK